jgi:hypothetical protein
MSNNLTQIQNVRITYTSKITCSIKHVIKQYVIKRKFFKLNLLQQHIKNKFNVLISNSSIYNILKNSNITYKKISKHISKPKQSQKIKKFLHNIKSYDPAKIISIDESSFDVFIYPSYGWSAKGIPIKHKKDYLK